MDKIIMRDEPALATVLNPGTDDIDADQLVERLLVHRYQFLIRLLKLLRTSAFLYGFISLIFFLSFKLSLLLRPRNTKIATAPQLVTYTESVDSGALILTGLLTASIAITVLAAASPFASREGSERGNRLDVDGTAKRLFSSVFAATALDAIAKVAGAITLSTFFDGGATGKSDPIGTAACLLLAAVTAILAADASLLVHAAEVRRVIDNSRREAELQRLNRAWSWWQSYNSHQPGVVQEISNYRRKKGRDFLLRVAWAIAVAAAPSLAFVVSAETFLISTWRFLLGVVAVTAVVGLLNLIVLASVCSMLAGVMIRNELDLAIGLFASMASITFLFSMVYAGVEIHGRLIPHILLIALCPLDLAVLLGSLVWNPSKSCSGRLFIVRQVMEAISVRHDGLACEAPGVPSKGRRAQSVARLLQSFYRSGSGSAAVT